MTAPDLLFPKPSLRLDARQVAQGVAFAYAAGEGAALLEGALREAKVGPSSFDPTQFAGDLFLDDLVKSYFLLKIDGRAFTPNRAFLARVLSHPPKDPACCAFRREILRELSEHSELRADLERTYVDLVTFRDLLVSSSATTAPEQHQHRVEVLGALKAVIEGLSTRFERAHSGLARLRAFGTELAARPAFADLSDLLRYEDGLAQVDVALRVGSDGSVRGFELARIQEAEGSRFHDGMWSRLWSRVVLFFRGYRFGELEVMARLLDHVFTPFEDDVVLLLQVTNDLEVYLGSLGFHDLALSRGLSVCLPELVAPSGKPQPRALFGLFNPLLIGERGAPRTCDIESERHDAIVLVTGPNSGGKTRLLQALAIAQLLAQNGLFAPARTARLTWTEGLFLSLSHEISATQREGRLGTELLRIRSLFDQLRPSDMVLFDELCSGTNPSEAEAIINLVLSLLSELHPQVFVTTHFLDFAQELARAPRGPLEFLQAELDEKKRPTYAFKKGVAKSALAAETAARLGVTLEELAAIVARRKADHRELLDLPEELAQAAEYAGAGR